MDGLSLQDQDLVARTMLAEGGDQGDNGLAAIAHVIRNRALGNDPDFPRDVTGVIHQRNAFTAWSNPRGRNNPNDFRSNDPNLQHARDIAGQVFSGQTPDPTNGATYYADVPLARKLYGKTPSFSKYPQTAQIGAHSFYSPNPPAPDLASEWSQPKSATPQSASPDLASEWARPASATFAERFAGEQPTQQEGGFVQGLAHGATQATSNILSRVGQAAQLEMGQPVDVPEPQQISSILQKEVTGPLTPGTGFMGRLGENIGGAVPYMLSVPSGGIGSSLVQAGLIGAGATVGEAATKGTSLEPYGGIIGGVAAPAAAPYLLQKAAGTLGTATAGLSGVTSGVGPTPVLKAFASGAEGGAAGQAFRGGLSGEVTPQNIVDQATHALTNMKMERAAQYQSSIGNLAENKSILNFHDINSAVSKSNSIQQFKRQELSPQTQSVRDEINAAIENWKSLDPAEYHTPVGFDALKKQIGNIKDSLPYDTPQRKVAENIYGAIRGTITKQAPEYADIMKGYEDASDQINEIKKTLSLNPKASLDTAFRKLTSTMRNNVNTNYGQRANLVNQLEQSGAPNLSSALAGHALNTMTPRGLAGGVAAAEVPLAFWSAYQYGGPKAVASLAATLPFQSPRLVGTMAHGLGRAYGKLPSVNATPLPLQALFSQRQKLPNANVPLLGQP